MPTTSTTSSSTLTGALIVSGDNASTIPATTSRAALRRNTRQKSRMPDVLYRRLDRPGGGLRWNDDDRTGGGRGEVACEPAAGRQAEAACAHTDEDQVGCLLCCDHGDRLGRIAESDAVLLAA